VRLTAAALRDAEFDVARMEARAAAGGTTMTELADRLVRDHGIPFGAAHAIAARMLKDGARSPETPLATRLAQASQAVLGRRLDYEQQELERVLSAKHFVTVRTTPGGPSPETTTPAVQESRRRLDADREWLTRTRAQVAAAAATLVARSRAL
jgi:argininosuccinate lyase